METGDQINEPNIGVKLGAYVTRIQIICLVMETCCHLKWCSASRHLCGSDRYSTGATGDLCPGAPAASQAEHTGALYDRCKRGNHVQMGFAFYFPVMSLSYALLEPGTVC